MKTTQDRDLDRQIPEIQGRYVLLKIGKKFASRRLRDGLRKILEAGLLNGEETVEFISLYAQVRNHLSRDEAQSKTRKRK